MSALSDKIAAEHRYAPWPDTVRGPIPYHLCAVGCEGVILEDHAELRRHVADVTEKAVAERIETRAKAEALREAENFLRANMDEPHGDRAANHLAVLAHPYENQARR